MRMKRMPTNESPRQSGPPQADDLRRSSGAPVATPGRPVLAGLSLLCAAAIAGAGSLSSRAATPGTLDLAFNPGSAVGTNYGGGVRAVLAQPDGRVVVGGQFSGVNGASHDHIVRLSPNGTVDETFQARVTAQGGYAAVDALVLAGTQILIGGTFDSVNGYARRGLARLNPDGTLDLAFNPNLGYIPQARLILVQPDGNIIVGGFAISASAGGAYRFDLVRLFPDGTLDLSFDIGLQGLGGFIYTGALQPDGKVLVGGFFPGDRCPTNIARFNANGSLDTAYWPRFDTVGIIYGLAVQADGKAVIAGDFDNVNGITRYGYARLHADGSLDTTFELRDAGTNCFSAGGRLTSVVIQPDQKILLGGMFMPWSGRFVDRAARFLTDGAPDPEFVSVIADTSVETLGMQSDGKILVGGWFSHFGGSPRKCIARLHGDAGTPSRVELALQRPRDGLARLTFATQPGRRYAVECSSDLQAWSEWTNFFAGSWLTQTADPASGASNRRFYRARLLP